MGLETWEADLVTEVLGTPDIYHPRDLGLVGEAGSPDKPAVGSVSSVQVNARSPL